MRRKGSFGNLIVGIMLIGAALWTLWAAIDGLCSGLFRQSFVVLFIATGGLMSGAHYLLIYFEVGKGPTRDEGNEDSQ